MIFKQLAMPAILFVQNEAKILQRQDFIVINIPCKFDEDIFINEWDTKVYAKTCRTEGWTHGWTYVRMAFYNLQATVFRRRLEITNDIFLQTSFHKFPKFNQLRSF